MAITEEMRAATLARPSAAQYEWQDMEIGMFFHWFPSFSSDFGGKWNFEQQKKCAETLKCDDLDMAQWVQSAKDLGAKYIVFVAKHGVGLCRWRSEYGTFNFANSKYPADDPRGDPLGTLQKECEKAGIRLGVYIAGATDILDAPGGGFTRDPARQEEYTKIYRGWLTEVLSKYGDMIEVWFDGSLELEIGDILKKYAPNAIVFQSKFANIRWVGQEEGYASDPAWNSLSRLDGITGVAIERHGNPDGDCYMPLECDARLRRRNWCYNPGSDNPLNSVEKLMDMYYNSVGHGANLLMNHAPAPSGRIPEEDMARMKEFGDEIRRRFGHPIATGSGEGEIVELPLGKKTAIDHVITMEELAGGERIRAYEIEAWDGEKWVHLVNGVSVGHKKIDYFNAFETDKIRIRVLKHVGTPLIRSISAHYAGVTPEIPEPVVYGEVKIGEYGSEQFDIQTRNAELAFDIGSFTKDAGQFHVSFRDCEGYAKLNISEAWITVHGVRMDQYLERESGNEFNVFAPGSGGDVVFHAKVPGRDGHVKGAVYYYRMA